MPGKEDDAQLVRADEKLTLVLLQRAPGGFGEIGRSGDEPGKVQRCGDYAGWGRLKSAKFLKCRTS